MNYKNELTNLQELLIEEKNILETLPSMNIDYKRIAHARLEEIKVLKMKFTPWELNNTQNLIQTLEEKEEPIKKNKRVIQQHSPQKKEKHKSFNLLGFMIAQHLINQKQPEMAMVAQLILR